MSPLQHHPATSPPPSTAVVARKSPPSTSIVVIKPAARLHTSRLPQQMEQTSIACGDQLPPLTANHPWFVAQNLDCTGGQTFYTTGDQLCRYKCRIPKLLGRLIRGYSHGWVILSTNRNMLSLWNPLTSKIINLPSLTLDNSEIIGQCCLSSPPDAPVSVLLLTITGKPTFVVCQLGFNRKINRLRWKKIQYHRQLKGITGHYDSFLQCLTSYNGKVYAMCNDGDFVIQVDIIVKNREVLLELLLHGRRPYPPHACYPMSISSLKGSSTELFYIIVAFNEVTKQTIGNVYIFKWVMASMMWEETADIKDVIFFVDLARDNSVYCNNGIASEFGGYIHIRDELSNMMYSYNIEDRSSSLSSMAYPTSHVSLWECRLEGDHEDSEKEEDKDDKVVVRTVTDDEVESHLLNLPSHLLETIMNHCLGVEYMSMRATCTSIRLAAPLIQWSNKTASRRLHKYAPVSPWLMVVDKSRDLITFTDPMLGDSYFMKRSQVSIRNERIRCSRFGWLLFFSDYSILVFLNPFTGEVRKLPRIVCYLESICFSAPPTSPDCIVVGFTQGGHGSCVCIYFVGREQDWLMIQLDFGYSTPDRFCFPTFSGRNLYLLCDKGEVYVLKNLFKLQGYYFKKLVGAKGREGEYFFVKNDHQFLLVIVGKFGKYVEVFKLNNWTKEWEKIECLGKHMIYICGTTCLCIEAKVPEMENKIFFPQLDSENNGKIVFYSLEKRRFHRFNGKNIEETVGFGMEQVFPHAWVEPTWS